MDVDSPMVDTNENISRRASISAIESAAAPSEVSVPNFLFVYSSEYVRAWKLHSLI